MKLVKKILKVLLYTLLGIIAAALLGSYIYFASFSPGDKGVPITESNLVYCQDRYDDCRESFLAAANELTVQYEKAELFNIQVPSISDDGLFIDFLYIPPLRDTSKLLVLTSGVHGVEGFSGSAVQQMFMKELLTTGVIEDMGILLIHAINPFGFKYERRVTENNVDLNRGSETDPSLFEQKNPGYTELYNLVNPAGKASVGSLRHQFFHLIAIKEMLRASMSVLRQAILLGQYEYPEGLYFGGLEFEPQIDSLTRILPGLFEPYETILEIDLHTAYGARRVLHLFPNPVDDPEIKAKTESVFEGKHIDWGDSDDFYTISGGFAADFMGRMNPKALYLYMVFEWGTFDSQKTFGSLKSIQRIIIENQGAQYGYKNQKQEEKIKEIHRELYYPSSPAWRSELIETGRDMLSLVLKTYPGVN